MLYMYTYVLIYFNGLNIFRFVRTYVTMGNRMTIRTRHTQTKRCLLLKILARAHNLLRAQFLIRAYIEIEGKLDFVTMDICKYISTDYLIRELTFSFLRPLVSALYV